MSPKLNRSDIKKRARELIEDILMLVKDLEPRVKVRLQSRLTELYALLEKL